ncbi:hypothetical protein LX16_1390 [Stackebrandtia albiflava]|uniref:Uncharacterized protein n=1 Tax=Stackebrandtia albiflava TaxID=406432 RepID=A0A562VCS7_9ACTN|nr:hypothetical protein [Stackebrandtia albiflava]TWJ15679.1 hypothetical protein LX16_1390 [Stackebrandtia albiflava]
MTQPPPYQGGYPGQQPPQQPGYGQQTPPPQQPGYGQQQGHPGQTPSGFPAAGGPGTPPPGGGFGGAAKNVGKNIALRIVIAVVVVVVLGAGGWIISVMTGDTSVADVGDCTTQALSAEDVKTVDCADPEAYFNIVAREDSPSGSDEVAVAEATCAGTDAAEYLYQEDARSGSLDWLICLDPINVDTPKWGSPAETGQCLADVSTSEYPLTIVDCGSAEAYEEVTASQSGLSGTMNDSEQEMNEAISVCGQEFDFYYSNLTEYPGELKWIFCVKSLA